MFASSEASTNPDFVKRRFWSVAFLVKMCDLKACFLLILPEPVSLKRFLALDLVFIFGMIQLLFIGVTYFFGAMVIFIFLPSMEGMCSTLPYSSRS
jgi:hypothetical protein